MRKFLSGVIFMALCLLFASSSWGQAQSTTGTVQGDVLDEKGGSVPGASVEAKNLDTNYIRNESTDGDGHFDKRTVFTEGLNLVSGIEVGFGGVYVDTGLNGCLQQRWVETRRGMRLRTVNVCAY